MVDSNESFVREIKEELDRERLANFWKRYGSLVIGAAAVLVVGVAGYQIWHSMERRAALEAGAAYERALDQVFDNKLDAAATQFADLAKSAPQGYAMLAELQYAATLAEQGKKPEALAEFEKTSKREGADNLIRSFAALQAAALRLGDGDFTEMQNRLTPLSADGKPWRFNALELLGMAALKAGNTDEAKAAFEEILAAATAPPAMRQRANLKMAQLSAAEPRAAAAAEDTTAKVPDTAAKSDDAPAKPDDALAKPDDALAKPDDATK